MREECEETGDSDRLTPYDPENLVDGALAAIAALFALALVLCAGVWLCVRLVAFLAIGGG